MWTQVLVTLPVLECVTFEAVWFLSFECWEIWSLSFSTKEYPMASCPTWHTLELVTFSTCRCQVLQQGCAVGSSGTDGAEFPAHSQPCPSAPHWAKPAKHIAIAPFKGDWPWFPKSRCGNSVFYRLCRILSGNFDLQTEGKRRHKLGACWSPPCPCRAAVGTSQAHLSLVGGVEMAGWGIKGFALSPAASSLGCPFQLPPDTEWRWWTPQGKESPGRSGGRSVSVVYSSELTSWLD